MTTPNARDLEKAREILKALSGSATESTYQERYLAKRLAAERASLPKSVVESLEFYAHGEWVYQDDWDMHPDDMATYAENVADSEIYQDMGQRAREALADAKDKGWVE